MSVRVRCPNSQCGYEAEVSEKVLGKSARCKTCGTTFILRAVEETKDGAAEVSLSMLEGDAAPRPDLPVLTQPGSTPEKKGPPPTAVEQAVPPGTLIGRFEIRERIGAGAFGTVYVAFDPQLQREVALKVPRQSVLSNPRRVERFLREARAAAKLRHPNIVPVYDAGQAGDQFYIASAFVRGEPLSDLVEDGGIDPKRAAKIVRALGEALAYAHREGVVHRDVKPANVMLDDQDQPLLMDFGLAAQVEAADDFQLPEEEAHERASHHDDARLTREGSVMGTPSYMAPEIARGHRGEAQPAADQYALGVVLYELLTGRTPFEGPPAAVLHQVIHESPPKPSEFRKDLPPDLEAVCLKAMARRPGERYVTCAALADDLRRWMDGEPVRARKLGFIQRTRRSMSENPVLALGGAGVVVAAMVVIGFLALEWSSAVAQGDEAAAQVRAEKDRAEEANAQRKSDQVRAARAAAQQKADADFLLAQEKVDAGNPSAAWDLLNGIPIELRHPGWTFLMARIQGLPEFRRVLPSQPTVALDFDGESRFVLQVASNGDLVICDVWTEREVRRLPLHLKGEEFYWHLAAMSADGKRIATFASPMNQPGGGPGVPIVMPAMPVPQKGVKAEPRKPQVVIWDEQGKQIRTIPVTDAPFRLALSRDGTLLAIAGGPRDGAQKLTLWNVDSGGRIAVMDKTLAEVPGPAFAMAFSWDGSQFAATTILEGGEIRVWNTATGEERLVIKDKTAVITHLAFSPDGTRLAAAGGGDRLEGPEITVKEYAPATYQFTVNVERDGKTVQEARTGTRYVEVPRKVRGYRYGRMKNVAKSVCEFQKKTRTVYKQVMKTETYTVIEEVKTKVKQQDGKEVEVTKKVPVQKQRTICVPVPVQEEYTVYATKSIVTQEMDIEPLVRIWRIDSGALETKITETGPVTALVWRADGTVLATATNLDNACDGASPCDCGGFHGGAYGGYGGYMAPSPAPAPSAPKKAEAVPDARTISQLLAALLGTCFGYGGMDQSCEADRAKVSLWDPATGQLLIALSTPSSPVAVIAFSPDNRHIAAGSSGFAGITLWSISSRWLLTNGRGDGAITDLLYSQDGNRLASFSLCNNTVRLWDGAAGSQVARLEGAGPFMQFLPSNSFLASRGLSTGYGCYGYMPVLGDTGLGRWASQDGQKEKHPGGRTGVRAYSADGSRFVVSEMMPKPRLVVYDRQTGAEVCTLAESAGTMVLLKIQVSKDGSRIAAVAPWGEALLWDGNTGKLLARRSEVTEADLSSDGNRWAVATRPVFAPPPGEMMPIPAPKNGGSKEPPKAPPEGTKKAGAAVRPGDFLISQEAVPQPKAVPKGEKVAPKGNEPIPIFAAPQPKPPTLTMFDGDGKEIAKLPGVEYRYDSLAFDPTGKTLIAVANGEVVRVYKADTGKLTAQFRASHAKVAVSPDGKYLAIHRPQPLFQQGGTAPTPKVAPKTLPPKADSKPVGPAKSEPVSQLPEPEPRKLPAPGPGGEPQPIGEPDTDLEPPFSSHEDGPGGRRAMFVTVIDLSNGQAVWNASVIGTGHGGMAFSADGRRLALGYVDDKAGYVQVWDTAAPEGGDKWKQKIVARYSGHYGAVNAVTFSPDGARLASGGADRVVKVWKLPVKGEPGPGADVPGIGGPAVVSAK
jgi:WD40 repeat protein/tRNA A-37 threonylcarbamoyl transferase component Bud32